MGRKHLSGLKLFLSPAVFVGSRVRPNIPLFYGKRVLGAAKSVGQECERCQLSGRGH